MEHALPQLVTEIVQLDDLPLETLRDLAISLGLEYAKFIRDAGIMALMIRKKVGYYDVIVDFKHGDLSGCKKLIHNSSDPPLNRPQVGPVPRNPLVPLQRPTFQPIVEEEFEVKYSGMAITTEEELVRVWKLSLTLTGYYGDHEDDIIDQDIENSKMTRTNKTRFPTQDLTFFVRNSEGKCRMSRTELAKARYILLDGCEYSLEGLSRAIEKEFRKQPADVIENISDDYLTFEMMQRGYSSRTGSRAFFDANMKETIRNRPTPEEMNTDIEPTAPVAAKITSRTLPNLADSIVARRMTSKTQETLCTLTPQELYNLASMTKMSMAPFKSSAETLQYLLLRMYYSMFSENTTTNPIPEYASIVEQIRDGKTKHAVIPSEACTYPEVFGARNTNDAATVFSFLNYVRFFDGTVAAKPITSELSNELAFAIAKMYGYNDKIVPECPHLYIENATVRYLAAEALIRNLLVFDDLNSWRLVEEYYIPDPDLNHRQNVLKFVSQIRSYLKIIEDDTTPVNPIFINYSDNNANLAFDLSSFSDKELQEIYNIVEWKGRDQALETIREEAKQSRWRLYSTSSRLCKNGANDMFEEPRILSEQYSFGTFNDMWCYTVYDILVNFLRLVGDGEEIGPAPTLISRHPNSYTIKNADGSPHFVEDPLASNYLNPGQRYQLIPYLSRTVGDQSLSPLIQSRSDLESLRSLIGGGGYGNSLSIVVRTMISAYENDDTAAFYLGRAAIEKYRDAQPATQQRFKKFLVNIFLMSMLSRFWLVGGREEFVHVMSEVDINDPTFIEARDLNLADFYRQVIVSDMSALASFSKFFYLPIVTQDAIQNIDSVAFSSLAMKSLFTILLTGKFCAQDFADKTFVFAYSYISTIAGKENFVSFLRDNYAPVYNGMPEAFPEFNLDRFVLTKHVDPLQRVGRL
jgi:hypothetical protein